MLVTTIRLGSIKARRWTVIDALVHSSVHCLCARTVTDMASADSPAPPYLHSRSDITDPGGADTEKGVFLFSTHTLNSLLHFYSPLVWCWDTFDLSTPYQTYSEVFMNPNMQPPTVKAHSASFMQKFSFYNQCSPQTLTSVWPQICFSEYYHKYIVWSVLKKQIKVVAGFFTHLNTCL